MNDKKLWNERVLPALNEMYTKSGNIFGSHDTFTWDILIKYSQARYDGKQVIPLFAFWLPMEKYDEICNKAVKGLRKYWHWPWRSEIIYDDEQIQSMQSELDELMKTDPDSWRVSDLTHKIKYNDIHKEHEQQWDNYQSEREVLDLAFDNGEITRKEYNKQRDKLCKSYGMTLRSIDAEKVRFTLMDCSPNSDLHNFEVMTVLYNELKHRLGTETQRNIDVVEDAAEEACNEDGMQHFKDDLVYAYMFYSNYMS